MKCDRCQIDVEPEYAVSQGSFNYCEDCMMALMSPAKACDPWAVKMAKGALKTDAEAVEALQGLEKRFYELVCAKGEVPKGELAGLLGATQDEVDRAGATLRHLELIRAKKLPDGGVVITGFKS